MIHTISLIFLIVLFVFMIIIFSLHQMINTSAQVIPIFNSTLQNGDGDHRATSTDPTQLFNAKLERKTGKNL